jgi:LPS export ABC transporter protein LptC
MSYKNLLILVLAVLVIGGGVAIWQSGKQDPDAIQTEAPQEDSTVTGKNVSFVVTEGETKKWKLDASQAFYNDDQSSARLKNVRGEFYDADGKAVMTFSAPEGNYANKNNAVILTGGVTAKSVKEGGGQMQAPKMTWSAKSQNVLAEGGVQMDFGEVGKSQASTARFALDFSVISLEGGVRSEIAP